MKFLLTYTTDPFNDNEKIIEIKSLKDLLNLAKKEENPLIIDFGGKQLRYDFEDELKRVKNKLDGIIEVYDGYRE